MNADPHHLIFLVLGVGLFCTILLKENEEAWIRKIYESIWHAASEGDERISVKTLHILSRTSTVSQDILRYVYGDNYLTWRSFFVSVSMCSFSLIFMIVVGYAIFSDGLLWVCLPVLFFFAKFIIKTKHMVILILYCFPFIFASIALSISLIFTESIRWAIVPLCFVIASLLDFVAISLTRSILPKIESAANLFASLTYIFLIFLSCSIVFLPSALAFVLPDEGTGADMSFAAIGNAIAEAVRMILTIATPIYNMFAVVFCTVFVSIFIISSSVKLISSLIPRWINIPVRIKLFENKRAILLVATVMIAYGVTGNSEMFTRMTDLIFK